MYLCQFGQHLAIGSEECRPGFFMELYEPGDLENKVKSQTSYTGFIKGSMSKIQGLFKDF